MKKNTGCQPNPLCQKPYFEKNQDWDSDQVVTSLVFDKRVLDHSNTVKSYPYEYLQLDA